MGKLIIRKAERRKAKLRLAIIGPTGSGKTYSALQLAFGLGGKVGMIDTENGSGDLYANVGDYDIITLEAPYTVQKYREAIRAFEDEGYETIIIDSLTHAWSGEGGLLDKSSQLEKSGKAKNSFAAWREITPEHNKLIEEMLGSPCHIIGTMRVKTEYVLEANDKGKMVPRKVGLAPVQRDGLEYEFTLVLDVDASHVASASKDRTGLFDGWYDKITPETGNRLLDWLNTGRDAPQRPVVLQSAPASPDQDNQEHQDEPPPRDKPVGPSANLERAKVFAQETIKALNIVLVEADGATAGDQAATVLTTIDDRERKFGYLKANQETRTLYDQIVRICSNPKIYGGLLPHLQNDFPALYDEVVGEIEKNKEAA